jgi:hypothetical protein
MRKGTIKAYANELLTKVSFTDIYGRHVGFDYLYILSLIKSKFPNSGITIRVLRWAAYELNRDDTVRVPARRHSRRLLARDFTRALLMETDPETNLGLSNRAIGDRVRSKFPEIRPLTLSKMRTQLVRAGMNPPPRPPTPTAKKKKPKRAK